MIMNYIRKKYYIIEIIREVELYCVYVPYVSYVFVYLRQIGTDINTTIEIDVNVYKYCISLFVNI